MVRFAIKFKVKTSLKQRLDFPDKQMDCKFWSDLHQVSG